MQQEANNDFQGGHIPNKNATVGKYFTYPDAGSRRIAQGGLRCLGKRKQSLPGMPLVTVITVCFNSSKTLEQCIQSVLHQTYKNIEYIVVDGGSSDGTLDLLERYKNDIDYFVSEPDNGLYYAMNKGLGLASGDYIIYLNSDDWYESDCVSRLLEGIAVSEADVSCALARRVDASGKEIDVLASMPYDDSLRFGMSLRHELMLVPSGIYDKVGGYNTNYRIIADFEFAIRLYNAGFTVYEIQKPLLNFRVTGISNTDWDRLVDEHLCLLKSQFPDIKTEHLQELADPRKYTAELIDRIAIQYTDKGKFVNSLISYGYRRALYNSTRPPSALQIKPDILVSVIVPAFKAEKTIKRCLQSILDQSLNEIEVLCVDDASPDGTAAEINEVAATDMRVHFLSNEKNIGVAASRNKALRSIRGKYVLFVDADDELMPGALRKLVDLAEREHCDLVKGGYERYLDDDSSHHAGLPNKGDMVTSLQDAPNLLSSTEGFWSYLYRSSFVKNLKFQESLKMGEDSLFLITALVRARRIGWLSEIVYRYHLHQYSAMNNFNYEKYINAIDWREKAWQILSDHNFTKLANWCAFEYWSKRYFEDMPFLLSAEEIQQVRARLYKMLHKTGYIGHASSSIGYVQSALDSIYYESQGGQVDSNSAMPAFSNSPSDWQDLSERREEISQIRVGVFSTLDKGGAADGSIRRVAFLRKAGVNAALYTLVTTKSLEYIHPLVAKEDQQEKWRLLMDLVFNPVTRDPGYMGSELFTLSRSVLDCESYKELLDRLDIVHLHWVAGLFDYQNFGRAVGKKGVAWTLADMNPFTGGCHYSEGCSEYERECRVCHLLPEGSTVAHENWKVKKAAYDQIRNMEIICPSSWMAERVSRSSLLGKRKINVIPNALPVDSFLPINKTVARIRLGLPVEGKFILFGADNVTNKRKGGHLLDQALRNLAAVCADKNVSVITFGHDSISFPFPVHNLAFLDGYEKLSLAYSAADVYAFPSVEDNAPLTVAESLMCGTPVVTFPVGNVPELVRHCETGYLAKYGDALDFSKGLAWALRPINEGERISIANKCRRMAITHHDPGVAVNRHLQVYLRLLKNSKSN